MYTQPQFITARHDDMLRAAAQHRLAVQARRARAARRSRAIAAPAWHLAALRLRNQLTIPFRAPDSHRNG